MPFPSHARPFPAIPVFCLARSKTWMAALRRVRVPWSRIVTIASPRRRNKPGHDAILARYRLNPHRRLDYLVGVFHRLAALDLVDVFHAFDHLAPDRVLVVEKARIVEADEKLAVAGIWIAGARHRHGTAHVRLAVEFGFKLFPRSPCASSVRAPRLRHEAIDHAMKDDAVIKSVLHQFLNPRHMSGCEIWPHLDHHFAFSRLERQRIFRIRHLTHPLTVQTINAVTGPVPAPRSGKVSCTCWAAHRDKPGDDNLFSVRSLLF